MAVELDNGRRSFKGLLRDLAEESSSLVRKEIRLARLEVIELVRMLGRGTAMVATGGVLAVLGALALLTGVIMLFGDQWMRDQVWLAALLVVLLTLVAAALFARHGAQLLSPERLAPDQTVATLKEDKEWLRRQLTSGATSR